MRLGALRFEGEIAGLGTSTGVRVVVGIWRESPLGSFTDVMIQQRDGHRVLLAPSREVADFVAATYTFDEIALGAVTSTDSGDRRSVTGPGLDLTFTVGTRTAIGWLLSALPRRLATAPGWLRLINPLARLMMRGVQTAGSAGGGRREFYGAFDVWRITEVNGVWRGQPLGSLTAVDPPVTFGFGSTPSTPALTSLVTTIR